ncbi:MAG: undecaprenyl-diphosphate phosphatase [Deltaproteobacteria bacterium]|nr:undecaprenyl-diphosphate phosphatase [Candidatus Zymogenaceae bacterium]
MPFFVVLILGIMQGLTEFLPVSSSGHLVVAQSYLPGFSGPPLPFDVLLHLGTLVSLTVYFYKDIWRIIKSFFVPSAHESTGFRRLGLLIVVGSIPTAVIGIGLEDVFERMFADPKMVPIMFLITALVLVCAEMYMRRKGDGRDGNNLSAEDNSLDHRTAKSVHVWQALLIGLVQGCAIVPGISRSGTTIAAGIISGVQKEESARFSFLLSIPAIFGAFLLHVKELACADIMYVAGAVAATLVGLVAIRLTINAVIGNKLWIFSVYLFVVAILVYALNFFL